MKFRIDLEVESSKEWINAVFSDFDSFLLDHANCERKASSMAMSFVAKYPNRLEIIPELINIAIEELDHFKDLKSFIEKRGLQLPHEIGQDHYVKQLLDKCHSGREERFLDRLLLASLLETRGAERFRMVYERMKDPDLKEFYRQLWASEARHGEVFIHMALNYFDENSVYTRLKDMTVYEAKILTNLPIKPALH